MNHSKTDYSAASGTRVVDFVVITKYYIQLMRSEITWVFY